LEKDKETKTVLKWKREGERERGSEEGGREGEGNRSHAF